MTRFIAACHPIEKLTDLEALISPGFTVSCPPAAIECASAGCVRAAAMVAQ